MNSQKPLIDNEELDVADVQRSQQIINEDFQRQEDDEVAVFKLNLEELLQTAEETQAEGDVLKDLINNFVASLSSNNSNNFDEAIKKIIELYPEHAQILADVKVVFESYKQQIVEKDDDFCQIKDSKLCQVKIQVEEILNIWINDQEGAKRIADNLMADETELHQVLSKFNINVDTSDASRVEALTGLNLYIQQKTQAPNQLRREKTALLLDANLVAECRVEMDKILISWELNPNHAKRAVDGLIQRNKGIFDEVLAQITAENKGEILEPLNNLKLYVETKLQNSSHQEEPQEEGEEGDVVEDENESPEKKGFFSRLFG